MSPMAVLTVLIFLISSTNSQFLQSNSRGASVQNFDCNPSTGCQNVGSNSPPLPYNGPVVTNSKPKVVTNSLPSRVASPPRKITNSPLRKVLSTQKPRVFSKATVTNQAPRRIISNNPLVGSLDKCKCMHSSKSGQMFVDIDYRYTCNNVSRLEDGSDVCNYKNNSDQYRTCRCD